MKRILLAIIFLISTVLVLLERLTPFYINNALLHYTILFVSISSFVLIVGKLFFKVQHTRFVPLTLLVVAAICFGKYFISWRGVWKTQTVLYENTEHPGTSIDFQMRADKLAFGYKKRVVERQRITPCADWTTKTDTLTLDFTKWKKVNLEVNELALKNWEGR